MSFSFYNDTKQKLSPSLQMESVSIGCEAWIDVNRFFATEKPGGLRTSGDQSRSATSSISLSKSFANLRRKFRKSSSEGLD